MIEMPRNERPSSIVKFLLAMSAAAFACGLTLGMALMSH
jgi:hypothetical protein